MHPVGDLLVGESEVTVGLWQQIKGEDQEDVCGAECPKSNINWLQALEFANQMSMLEGLDSAIGRSRQKNHSGSGDRDGLYGVSFADRCRVDQVF